MSWFEGQIQVGRGKIAGISPLMDLQQIGMLDVRAISFSSTLWSEEGWWTLIMSDGKVTGSACPPRIYEIKGKGNAGPSTVV